MQRRNFLLALGFGLAAAAARAGMPAFSRQAGAWSRQRLLAAEAAAAAAKQQAATTDGYKEIRTS